MATRLRCNDDTLRWTVAGLVLAVVVGAPMVVSGPGNDLDIANIFRSGRSLVRHGHYLPSRAPGAPVHELIVGVFDRLGGPLLTNLASVAAAVVFTVALDRLLAGEGLGPHRRWAIALVVANPWFLIAATGSVDYVFALAFVVLAALALRRGHPVWAGLAAAASMGCRIGSALLVAALMLAELTEPIHPTPTTADPDYGSGAGTGAGAGAGTGGASDAGTDGAPEAGRRWRTGPGRGTRWRRPLVTAVTALVATVVMFVPSFLEAGGLAFAQNDFSTSSTLVQLGRAAVKDVTLLGPVATVVGLAAVPAVLAALRGWRTSWLLRFAVPGFVLSQLLFIRFPWKLPHLLPCLVCLAVVLAVASADRARLLMALVALQLVFAVVQVQVFRPDRANEASGGSITLDVGWGPLVTDWRCRRDHPDAYLGRQKVEVEAAWNCSQPFDR